MSTSEKLVFEEKLYQKTVSGTSNINDDIVVFGIEGCLRYHYTTSYLIENSIDFRYMNTTKNNKQNKL